MMSGGVITTHRCHDHCAPCDNYCAVNPSAIPRGASRPFTVPPFHPTLEHAANMTRLLVLILAGADAPFEAKGLETAELHRELGQFDAATAALCTVNEDHQAVTKKVIEGQIADRCASPIRYRM